MSLGQRLFHYPSWKNGSEIWVLNNPVMSISVVMTTPRSSLGIGLEVKVGINVNSKVNNVNITSPEEIADAFNEYFVKVGPNLVCSMADSDVTFDQFVNPTQTQMFRFKLVSVSKVFKLLNGLPNTKATGLDKIPSKVP